MRVAKRQSQSSLISDDDDEVDPAISAVITFSNIAGQMIKVMASSADDKTTRSGEDFRKELGASASACINLAKKINKTLGSSKDYKTVKSGSDFRKNLNSEILLAQHKGAPLKKIKDEKA